MADATRYEGWQIDARVNFSEIEKANQAVDRLLAKFTKIDRPLNHAGIPSSVAKQIGHVDALTGSYIHKLESEGKQYEANKARIEVYTSSIDKLTRKQASLENQLSRIAEKTGQASKEYKNQQVRINETTASLNEMKHKLKETQVETEKIKPSRFNTMANWSKKSVKAIDTVKGTAKSAFQSIKGGAMVAGGTIASLTAMSVSGAKESATLQQRFKEINNLAVLGGEKQKDVTASLAKMQSEARDISIKYGKSQVEIADGYEDLVKRGYTTKQAIGALRTEIQASVASGDDFSDVTTVSSQVLDAFGMRADSTSKMLKNTKQVVNELAYAADATSTGFQDMGVGMSYVGAVAKQQNISLAQTASAMGVLSNNGLESDKAGTGLRSTINGISNQVNKLKSGKGIFAQLGITSKEMLDAKGHLKPLADTLDTIYKHIKQHSSNSVEESGFFKSIFGTTGQNAAQILASNTNELRKLTKETEKAGKGDYVSKLADKNSQTAKVQMAKMKQMTNAFKMDIGANLLPAINEAGNSLAKFLNTKDGKKFEKNVAGLVKKTADALVNLIKWSSGHTNELKFIGGAVLAGYSTAKALSFINFLKKAKDGYDALKVSSKAFSKTTDFASGAMKSARSVGGFKNLSMAGKVSTGLAGAGIAVSAVNDIYKGIKSKTKKGKFEGIGQGIGGAIGGGIGLWFGGPLGAAIGTKIGQTVGKWGGNAALKLQKGWNSKKPPKKFWSLENLGWSSHDALNKMVKWGGGMINSLTKGVKSYINEFKSVWGGIFKWIGDKVDWYVKAVRGAWDKVAGWIGKGVNTVKGWFGGGSKKIKHHVAGGYISADHIALVGEEGPELAYQTKGGARLLGAKGPSITKVKAGERILNARDTAKLFNGGLGKGLALKGYASGTTSLTKSKTDLSNASKKTIEAFKKIAKGVDKETKKTSKNSVGNYTLMTKKVQKQMNLMQSGVTNTAQSTSKGFGKALSKMKGFAGATMSATIGQLNKGITGIDKVLSQFGGNSTVIKPVHFATGSNGKLPSDTLAMVNDATSGPRQEAIIRGSDIIIPSGNNRILPLQKGDQVLNGKQTQQLAESWGLPHFAKGSGVSHSELRRIAKNGLKDPNKSFNLNFLDLISSKMPAIQKGTTDLAKRASDNLGSKWMGAIWQVINNAIGSSSGKGGTREAFLKYAESNFSHIPYVMGAMSKLASDCSGMVAMALKHFGIDIGRTTVAMQESRGVEYLGKDIKKTVPGDLVIYGHGTGAAGHVGIIKDPVKHTMFNETPPYSRVTSVDTPMSMGYGYYRVRGLHDAKQKKRAKYDNKLMMALAKKQLGSTAIKWIERNLGDDLGSLGSFKLGGDIATRAIKLAKALKELDPRATKSGIAAILGNWQFESGLNPAAVNPSGGASGFGQWLGGRLANLKEYARRKGKSWTNPAVQLEFALKGDGSDSSIFRSILEGKGNIADLANRFSSEWERGGYNAQHVNGAKQIAQALGYRTGGNPAMGNLVKVGENGPELAEFKSPVHIYSADETKRMEMNFGKSKEQTLRHVKREKPVFNININGPISSEHDANKFADIIASKINQIFEQFGDEFGLDPSVY